MDRFFYRCNFCGLCLEKCPTRVLTPSPFKDFATNLPKPIMDYEKSFCSYECNICLKVCPSGAISFFDLPKKKLIKIGSSKLNENLCIPFVKNKDCTACAEHCPTGAIKTVRKNNVAFPEIRPTYCIGCGACQNSCPVLPTRAILVKPENIHTFADDPKTLEKIDKPVSDKMVDDFPF